MKKSAIVALLMATAAAAPLSPGTAEEPSKTRPLDKRATTVCGQWDSVQTGGYTVYNNLWGKDSGTGSQCLTVNGMSPNGLLSWSAAWSWSGGPYSVKSYPNAVVSAPAARLSAVSSIPTRWQWSYSGSNLVANVAYDLFTSSNCGTTPEYEIMVWLGALGGAGPISSTGRPVATADIGGKAWRLYKGAHSQMTVFSFVAAAGNINDYSGDLNGFVRYLTSSQGMPASQCLYSAGGGTEPFTGSNAKFTTTAYSLSITAGGSGGGGGGGGGGGSGGGACAARWAQCGGQGWTGSTCCVEGPCTRVNEWYSQCS